MTGARLLLATRSPDKLREIRQLLGPSPDLELITLQQLGLAPDPAEDDVEAFPSFRENALAKARFFLERTGLPVLADDSGIEVEALGGAPGVRSRRFAARPGLEGLALDQANNRLLLERLHGVPASGRGARYVCAAVLLAPGTSATTALGTCHGRILEAPRGQGGFGYDPLFLLPQVGLTFGQIDDAAKHRFSHRARAIRALQPRALALASRP